jgi:hypothetical protein
MMDAEERDIFFYLREQREQFVSAIAIGRHAGGKHKFREAPSWAKPALSRMVERGILEMDEASCYRLKPIPEPTTGKQWVSPQIANILKRSGKNFKGLVDSAGGDEAYYDKL